jgi:hypothetical protein
MTTAQGRACQGMAGGAACRVVYPPGVGERPSDSEIRTTLRAYFAMLQSTLPQMRCGRRSSPTTSRPGSSVVTCGAARTASVTSWRLGPGSWMSSTTSTRCLEREDLPSGEVRIKTCLEFSLRQPDSDELFTGTAFHTWLLRRDAAGRLQVAAQLVDGFADLNDNAQRLFAIPDQGLNR